MTQTEKIVKTGEFVEDVRAGYYRQERDAAYLTAKATGASNWNTIARENTNAIEAIWTEDFRRFLLGQGVVPTKYVDKVMEIAERLGHSSGEEEVLNYAYDLIEIFQD